DLVMYDRQTESWWQQFGGDAIVGVMSGKHLRLVPSRLESFGRFRQRFPDGQVLIPNNPRTRNYGTNPYVGYDASGQKPFLYDGSLPDGIDPMERVVAVETWPGYHEAWSLPLLRERGTIEAGDIVLKWKAGQTSALDTGTIGGGRDIGNVVVQRQQSGQMSDIAYNVTFAFSFHAFRPDSPIHKRTSAGRENGRRPRPPCRVATKSSLAPRRGLAARRRRNSEFIERQIRHHAAAAGAGIQNDLVGAAEHALHGFEIHAFA